MQYHKRIREKSLTNILFIIESFCVCVHEICSKNHLGNLSAKSRIIKFLVSSIL